MDQRGPVAKGEDVMSEDVQVKPVKPTPLVQRFIIYAGVILVTFLLGFRPDVAQSSDSQQ